MVKRIRPASIYQRKDSPLRLIAVLGARTIKRAVKGSLQHLSDLVDTDRLAKLIKAGFHSKVSEAIDWQHFGEVLKATFDKIADVRETAAALGVRKINGTFAAKRRRVRFHTERFLKSSSLDELFDKGIGDRFNFDRFAPGTVQRIRDAQDRLIKDLTEQARDTIEKIVMDGTQAGLSADEITSDIRDMIGLTETQTSAVMNYRSMLEGLDSDALRRQLRNKTLDDDVLAAIGSGEALDAAFIDSAVSDYIDNYLNYRATSIAQTEATRAASAGLQDSYLQAIERGALPSAAIRQNWKISLDEKTCPVCLSIPDMNPDGRAIGEQFESIEGPFYAPPDPHPRCRCEIEITTDLDAVAATDDLSLEAETV